MENVDGWRKQRTAAPGVASVHAPRWWQHTHTHTHAHAHAHTHTRTFRRTAAAFLCGGRGRVAGRICTWRRGGPAGSAAGCPPQPSPPSPPAARRELCAGHPLAFRWPRVGGGEPAAAPVSPASARLSSTRSTDAGLGRCGAHCRHAVAATTEANAAAATPAPSPASAHTPAAATPAPSPADTAAAAATAAAPAAAPVLLLLQIPPLLPPSAPAPSADAAAAASAGLTSSSLDASICR